jgi:hypothetical protein
LVHDRFRLEPLGPEHLEIDYEGIVASADHLDGTMMPTGWMSGDFNFTLDDDVTELHWHAREFRTKSSFAFIAVDSGQHRSLGCAYVNPSERAGFDAEVTCWGRWMDEDPEWDATFFSTIEQWVESQWPFERVVYPGRSISWSDWMLLPPR